MRVGKNFSLGLCSFDTSRLRPCSGHQSGMASVSTLMASDGVVTSTAAAMSSAHSRARRWSAVLISEAGSSSASPPASTSTASASLLLVRLGDGESDMPSRLSNLLCTGARGRFVLRAKKTLRGARRSFFG